MKRRRQETTIIEPSMHYSVVVSFPITNWKGDTITKRSLEIVKLAKRNYDGYESTNPFRMFFYFVSKKSAERLVGKIGDIKIRGINAIMDRNTMPIKMTRYWTEEV